MSLVLAYTFFLSRTVKFYKNIEAEKSQNLRTCLAEHDETELVLYILNSVETVSC